MVSFENFVKSMPRSLSELKVTPIFCFAFKIPDDVTASNNYGVHKSPQLMHQDFEQKPVFFLLSSKSDVMLD